MNKTESNPHNQLWDYRFFTRPKQKPPQWRFYSGGRAGTRTLDPLIKSQLLYQLSYASKTHFSQVFTQLRRADYISFYNICKDLLFLHTYIQNG